ncbi:hypothetical protein [Tenacibaculum soleae]|uniref:hypothetical protein n=1 Tax=Tenacibaculum soleae TaxID=447689 RepID=UPI0023002203|nr:hypothetical protein [Tenacibaculum soleae]
MGLKFKIYTTIYFLACFVSLFFIDAGTSLEEMVVKILSLVFLAFLYISVSKDINYWYILILMCIIGSDSFFVFDPDFLTEGVILVLIERFLYFIILRKTLSKIKIVSLLTYMIPGILIFGTVLYIYLPYLKDMLGTLFIICFFNITLISIAYLNFLQKNDQKNLFFLLGIFMISGVDFLMVYNKYLDYNFYYVIGYTLTYYTARYLICYSIIEERYR